MVAVGADQQRTCTCGLVKWDGTAPSAAPREVIAFDPAVRDENDEEMMVRSLHSFDGTPCRMVK